MLSSCQAIMHHYRKCSSYRLMHDSGMLGYFCPGRPSGFLLLVLLLSAQSLLITEVRRGVATFLCIMLGAEAAKAKQAASISETLRSGMRR